jgi:glutaredoxin
MAMAARGIGSMMSTAELTIEAYWMPGCSSCLRMKEFLEKSGKPFLAVNVDEHPEARVKLNAHSMLLPAVAVGDRMVNGVDLGAVAELIGVPYEPPVMMPPAQLVERYRAVLGVARRYIPQMTPEMLGYTLPNRNRPMLHVANQVASVMRAFLTAYEDDAHDKDFYSMPADITTREQVLDRLDTTLAMFDRWWKLDGFDDPLDRVTPTYWGYPTLHEVLEREVWHTTQHTRQLEYVITLHGAAPEVPLTRETYLDGLPLPERIND